MRAKPGGGGDRFGQFVGQILLVEQRLPLQIAQLQKIAIDDSQPPDAGPNQQIGHMRSERSAAAQQGRAGGEPLLPFDAQRREAHLALVAGQFRGGGRAVRRHRLSVWDPCVSRCRISLARLNQVTGHLQSLGSQVALQSIACNASLDRRRPIAAGRTATIGNRQPATLRAKSAASATSQNSNWAQAAGSIAASARDGLSEQHVSGVAAQIVVAVVVVRRRCQNSNSHGRPASQPAQFGRHVSAAGQPSHQQHAQSTGRSQSRSAGWSTIAASGASCQAAER